MNRTYSRWELGACPTDRLRSGSTRSDLGLAETLIPTAIVTVGYAAEDGAPESSATR